MVMSCITARNETVPWLLWTWLMAAPGKHTRNTSKAGKSQTVGKGNAEKKNIGLLSLASDCCPKSRFWRVQKQREGDVVSELTLVLGCLSYNSGLWPSPCARASLLTHELKQKLSKRKSTTLILGTRIYQLDLQQVNMKPSADFQPWAFYLLWDSLST